MKKKEMNKKLFVISAIFILLFGILITAQDIGKIRDKIASSISDKADKYIDKFVEKKEIKVESITNVTEINLEKLPSEINIGDVKDADIAFYQIDFNDAGKSNRIFVVSFLADGLKMEKPFEPKNVTITPPTKGLPSQIVPKNLAFRFTGEMDKTGFLESVAGISGSINDGYIMSGSGNIVNVSTDLEVYEGKGTIGITLYKNGVPTLLTTSFVIDPDKLIVNPDTKSYFVYGILSQGNVSFKNGDIISVYVTLSDGVILKSITTSVQTG